MSPRAARAASLPFALLAFTLRLLHTFWVVPLTFRIGSDTGAFLAWAGGLTASVVLPWGGYLLLTRQARVRPAAFDIDVTGHRFVAPATPAWNGAWAVIFGWLAGNSIITERVPGMDRMRPAALSPVSAAGAALAVTALVLIAITALQPRPLLILGRDAMTEYRTLRHSRIGWNQLVPGGPAMPARRGLELLTLYTWDASTAGSFSSRQLVARNFHVDPAFLAHTIRTYAAESAHRSRIGTAGELARLQETFAAGPSAH